MDCKEAEKSIPAFLRDDLDNRELRDFIEHIGGCAECSEELSIQFLVLEGMERLESGNNFNLQKALDERIGGAEKEIKLHQGLKHTLFCLEMAVATVILIAAVIIFKLQGGF